MAYTRISRLCPARVAAFLPIIAFPQSLIDIRYILLADMEQFHRRCDDVIVGQTEEAAEQGVSIH
jgi:hypothetical protein